MGGDAPSQQAIDAAVKVIAGTYGVRIVTSGARVVVLPPVALLAPTVNALIANSATPEIKGTWQEGVAKTLAVTMAGKVFTLGTDAALTSSAGTWALKPSSPLADGTYDVTAQISDGVNPAVGTAEPTKIVVDTVAPAAPVVTPLASGIQWPYTLNGTWAEGDAISLVAKLAGKTWTLGKDDALKSDGKGNWSFAPVVDLKPGAYDVTFESSDLAGNTSITTAAAAIVVPPPTPSTAAPIPAPMPTKIFEPASPTVPAAAVPATKTTAPAPPAAVPAATMAEQTPPTVTLFSDQQSPSSLAGTWDQAHATGLKISVPGANLSASLGTDAALSSAKGAWTLALSQGLPPGVYNVIAESTDAAGKTVADQTTAEIYIKTPAPPPPPPSYDCAGVLAKISGVFPLRFEFNQTRLKPPLDLAVNQYAAVLKDPRCATVNAEIAGHADFFGPRLYNQALSEARAQTVVSALVAAGVEAPRLSTQGFSEFDALPIRKKRCGAEEESPC